jgi:hypothetical protein
VPLGNKARPVQLVLKVKEDSKVFKAKLVQPALKATLVSKVSKV